MRPPAGRPTCCPKGRRRSRTSKTPGRTQTINFYDLAGEARLVDLPGYGYARVPRSLRAQWGELVGAYLRSRPTLAGVVVVMDARHPCTQLDQQLLDWLLDVRTLVLLSKADKLSRAEQQATLKSVAASLDAEVRLFSSVTRQGGAIVRDKLRSESTASASTITGRSSASSRSSISRVAPIFR